VTSFTSCRSGTRRQEKFAKRLSVYKSDNLRYPGYQTIRRYVIDLSQLIWQLHIALAKEAALALHRERHEPAETASSTVRAGDLEVGFVDG
jgi:hypothetical protein